jgi:hypothetical protein
MSAPGKLVRSSRWKSGPSKGQRPLGSECCVTPGDSGHEAYTAIAWGVGLSLERSDIAGAEGFRPARPNRNGTVKHCWKRPGRGFRRHWRLNVVAYEGGRPDCVADDAVICEPVSAANFPANREINREFR